MTIDFVDKEVLVDVDPVADKFYDEDDGTDAMNGLYITYIFDDIMLIGICRWRCHPLTISWSFGHGLDQIVDNRVDDERTCQYWTMF